MKNITGEMIDHAINKMFLESKENFFNDFWKNYKHCKGVIEEISENEDDIYRQYLASDFAAYKTAMDYGVEMLRAVLKELLCE